MTESGSSPRIDEALASLAELDTLDVAEHPEKFEAVHRLLRDELANAGASPQ